ncbi:MAG: MarC family protein [Candidatus Omnitrophica bacterium]|nr:MarC family protein [Candidatus Omnitrophota bacterium]
MLNEILLAFIPMFFAMDSVGILPVFAGLTRGLPDADKRNIIVQSLGTATILAISFIFLGKVIFNFLGISMGDFMIAGGMILFCLSMVDLMGQTLHTRKMKPLELAAVPIGTPLIVGPAVLTMALMLMNQYGWAVTLVAVLSNIAIVGIVFLFSDRFISIIGPSGSRALSKVMYLLLAAIGVMMVRKGILVVISTVRVPGQ